MARPHSPTARHRRLIVELIRFREACGLSRAEAAERIGASETSVFRYEKGLSRPQPAHVAALMDAYGVTGAQRAELIQLAKEARKRGWWHRHRDTFKPGFDVFIGLEAEASILRTYEVQVVPGLLQTEDYARAVLQATSLNQLRRRQDQEIEVRMQRQALLSGPDAVQLSAILDESVLRRRVGSQAVMKGQLQHLIEISERPNITLQVLPFRLGAHAAMNGSFVLVEFAEPTADALVYVELATSGLALEDQTEISRYTLIYGQLSAIALSPEESIDLITDAAHS